jgi:hypothetical protein
VEVVEERERVGGGGETWGEEGIEGGGEVGVLGQRADGVEERLERAEEGCAEGSDGAGG